MRPPAERRLKLFFLAGAIADVGALLPMLHPPTAGLVWGVQDDSWSFRFAMGYGASLMLGWTALLLWAFRRPMERRFVAALTCLVIIGLILTESVAVYAGAIAVRRMAPTWCLQSLLLGLFAWAYRSGIAPRRAAG